MSPSVPGKMQSVGVAGQESRLPSHSNVSCPFVINPSAARVLGSRAGGRLVWRPQECHLQKRYLGLWAALINNLSPPRLSLGAELQSPPSRAETSQEGPHRPAAPSNMYFLLCHVTLPGDRLATATSPWPLRCGQTPGLAQRKSPCPHPSMPLHLPLLCFSSPPQSRFPQTRADQTGVPKT